MDQDFTGKMTIRVEGAEEIELGEITTKFFACYPDCGILEGKSVALNTTYRFYVPLKYLKQLARITSQVTDAHNEEKAWETL